MAHHLKENEREIDWRAHPQRGKGCHHARNQWARRHSLGRHTKRRIATGVLFRWRAKRSGPSGSRGDCRQAGKCCRPAWSVTAVGQNDDVKLTGRRQVLYRKAAMLMRDVREMSGEW